jgi:hypothetical protein
VTSDENNGERFFHPRMLNDLRVLATNDISYSTRNIATFPNHN